MKVKYCTCQFNRGARSVTKENKCKYCGCDVK